MFQIFSALALSDIYSDVKELTYAAFGKITKDVWIKAEEHVVKIEKEYCKENCKHLLIGRWYCFSHEIFDLHSY
jgi:hypothetical protein